MTTTASTLPATMRAIAFDAYGGPERLTLHVLPVPDLGPDEVLVEVEAAGVGVWDAKQREGATAAMEPDGGLPFPVVPGADGAGTVRVVGAAVRDFAIGDHVYGYSFLSPKGGFHAEYAAVPADAVARIPAGLDVVEAAALAVPAITALRGLDALHVKRGDRVLVFAASGGVGHVAVQLAKALGADVMAVVSSEDGADLARSLGADPVVDVRLDDLPLALRSFAPHGLDAVFAAANGDGLAQAIADLKPGGRVGWPNGVEPVPEAGPDVVASAFDGRPDRDLLDRLNALIESLRDHHPRFTVHVARTFAFADAADAHRAMTSHHLGRMVLQPK